MISVNAAASAKRSLLVPLVCLMVLAIAFVPERSNAAVRYTDTRFDPNDVPMANDLRSTTRTVLTTAKGLRVLKVVLRGYQAWPRFPDGVEGVIRLDTRGDGRADHRLIFRTGNDFSCLIDGRYEFRYRVEGDRLVCRAPISELRPRKKIRWKVVVRDVHGGPTDFAPNGFGWFR